jgi:hypothetical protein
MTRSPAPARSAPGAGRLAVLALFAAAMGWLEAVVVVYIRGLLGLAHAATPPPPQEIAGRFANLPWLMPTEQGREAATILMLLAVGWLAGRSLRSRFGAFLIAFGVWDIVYYLALVALVRWPTSLASMDLLFLIPPHPWWSQPVWVPVVISCGMIAIGARLFLRDRAARAG